MRTGQSKYSMQTFNQWRNSLRRICSNAMARTSYADELQEIINRGPAAMNPTVGVEGRS